MTQPDNFWARKIHAFLSTPPDVSLAPDGKEERARDLIAKALELPPDQVQVAPEAAGACHVAAGLDIPPFVSTWPRNVFHQEPILTHPLSGEAYSLSDMANLSASDPAARRSLITAAVQQIREEVVRSQTEPVQQHQQRGANPLEKRVFLALWRLLPDTIRRLEAQYGVAGLGPLWDVLPADPRIPSHSVWDHAAVSAAVAGALPEPALLIFTIASAQDFVTTARRTQDFWMGSFLLSYLTWTAIKEVADCCGPDCLVYPNLHGQPLVDLWLRQEKHIAAPASKPGALQIANFPNMFTAIVPTDQARALADKARYALLKKWEKLAFQVKSAVEKEVQQQRCHLALTGDTTWEKSWRRQIEDCFPRLGIFWVMCPWGKDPAAVQSAYEALLPRDWQEAHEKDPQHVVYYRDLKRLIEVASQPTEPSIGMVYPLLSTMAAHELTARKLLRDFTQQEEPEWKCSLCGLRQALRPEHAQLRRQFPAARSDEERLRLFWEWLGDIDGATLKLQGRIRQGDRLCAVCLTKRLVLEVCFKREPGTDDDGLGFDHHLFPSTATLATAPFKAQVIKQFQQSELPELTRYAQATATFLQQAKILYPSSTPPKVEQLLPGTGKQSAVVEKFLRLDGEWLFEESFDREKIRREYRIDGENLDEASRLDSVEALRALLAAACGRQVQPPSRYYAVVAMDGDKMGNWVGGLLGPNFDLLFHPRVHDHAAGLLGHNGQSFRRPLGPTLHLSLSGALKNFALHLVRWVVEEQHHGKLIYAGGDDVLAFLPVSDLLPALRMLRRLFQGDSFGEELSLPVKAKGGFATLSQADGDRLLLLAGAPHLPVSELLQGVTVSAGVAIVHESQPLTQAIDAALHSAMKDHAKERLGRDAFAIHLHKRAGGPVEAGMRWYGPLEQTQEPRSSSTQVERVDILEHLITIIRCIQQGALSSRLPYSMAQKRAGLEGSLKGVPSGVSPWWHTAQLQELSRLTNRHLHEEAKQANMIQQCLHALLTAIQHCERERVAQDVTGSNTSDESWTMLTNLLLVARFIAEESAYVAGD